MILSMHTCVLLIGWFGSKMIINNTLTTGEFQIDTGWGLVKCAPNNGYVVIYGEKEDGSLDANFLTKGTPSFAQYFVVDNDGNIVQSLEAYDQQLEEQLSSSSKRK